MAEEIVILVTCPTDQADKIARPVVEERLAACVNVVHNVASTYRWHDKIEVSTEDLLILKSNSSHWKALEARVKELHPYDTPEIICFGIRDGYAPYLEWLNSSLGSNN